MRLVVCFDRISKTTEDIPPIDEHRLQMMEQLTPGACSALYLLVGLAHTAHGWVEVDLHRSTCETSGGEWYPPVSSMGILVSAFLTLGMLGLVTFNVETMTVRPVPDTIRPLLQSTGGGN